ncbi:coagulation factor 5/8 type domain protein [Sphingomonas sp. MA1305]|uniref:family 43 glycosylhydrolase n=1 Tax=Sphingomonas sp. MA1305 TaxID=2479204 RepID=UPI0018DF2EB1|nr:family 43 glycosylhydrolase [Sphingomonas sp. MA1305]MBI0475499.1 coagulation factor 5/8 type domain protein [Sphingomonas sp. MA1305]
MIASLVLAAAAQATAAPHTYANPVDLDYRYNFEQVNEGVSYRTGADPVIVPFKGAYYLFLTLADGYWRSTDLVTWRFVTPSRWPAEGIVAPAVSSDGERLLIMPSMTGQGAIYGTSDPASGRIDYYVRRMPVLPGAVKSGFEDTIKGDQVPPGPWDPDLFQDDDKRWYLYWNSSNVFPIYGAPVSFADGRMTYGSPRKSFILLDPDRHGWERFGQDHSGTLPNGTPIKPFMEGAWMTKVGGRYYLQYGAPGTEYNAYATGTYVGSSPMGPFTYAPYNPVGYKPGGFVQGAGHGNTFRDLHGNWWNTGTPWIGYNWTFERRIGMWPTVFDADGQMRVSTRFGDFPQRMPTTRFTDPDSLFTGWMLLSYRKAATASGSVDGHPASDTTDENPRSFWLSPSKAPGATLTIDLGAAKTLRAVQVNFADYQAGRFGDAPDIYTEFRLESSLDGQAWRPLARTEPPRRDRPNAYFELPRPVRARFVRYVHGHVGGAHLAISDLRVFGTAGGAAPPPPTLLAATRDRDTRNATIRWTRVPSAVGYNVRWGIRPDRLALTYQLFADRVAGGRAAALPLRALTVGQRYYVAVEAFDENGVSTLSRVAPL